MVATKNTETESNEVAVPAHVDMSEIDTAIAKAEKLVSLLEAANALLDELAASHVKATCELELDG